MSDKLIKSRAMIRLDTSKGEGKYKLSKDSCDPDKTYSYEEWHLNVWIDGDGEYYLCHPSLPIKLYQEDLMEISDHLEKINQTNPYRNNHN